MKQQRDKVVVATRIPPKVKRILEAEAKKIGISLGEYVRRILVLKGKR